MIEARYVIVDIIEMRDWFEEVLDKGTTEAEAIARAEKEWFCKCKHDQERSVVDLVLVAYDEDEDRLVFEDDGYKGDLDTICDYTPIVSFGNRD